MTEWIPVGDGFIEADVIRWKEPFYDKRSPRSGRSAKFGDRLVTAEVLRMPDNEEWVYLLVRGCEVVSEKPARTVYRLPKGTEARRKRQTIVRGKAERLLWSDESARAMLVSRFLGNR